MKEHDDDQADQTDRSRARGLAGAGCRSSATAAPWHGAGELRSQINQLDRKVEQAERRHLISRQEATGSTGW